MTFAFIAAVYVLGGITFVPLLLAAVLIPAWYLLPQTVDDHLTKTKDDSIVESIPEAPLSPDGAASGTFAVLRSHNFQAANTALNARNNSSNNQAGLESDGEVPAHSESVYQSMYRSVFDRGKSAAANNTVLEKDDIQSSSNAKSKKNVVPVNIFHIVLRHGHLMLYDSAAQVEVRHVISMANHTISLSEGGSAEEDEEMKDGDLFIKRTAIVLTPVEYPNGQLQPKTTAAKPFYLFSTTCSEKEDFYHALLHTRAKPPSPIPLDPTDAIKLQSALHSTSLTPETKALNAMIGRVFLALYRTDRIKDLIQRKVEKKISRVSKPAFIASLSVHSVDLGDASPLLSNLRLRDFNIDGDMTMAMDIRYDGGVRSSDGLQKRTGGIKLTISALAKLDLGPRFKTRTVDLLLATSLQRLHGRMLIRVKPPPTNRIWFCFESMPEMDIKVEPVVSQRQITYTFVLRAIEERIRAVVGETLVKPNWDDVPFFSTKGQTVRGGIWQDEGSDIRLDDDNQPSMLGSRHGKTMSMPALVGEADSSGTSSGSENTSKMASGSSLAAQYLTEDLKRRSVTSLPPRSTGTASEVEGAASPQRVRSLRSPSFTKAGTSAASVSINDVTAEHVRARDVATPPPRLWRMRPPQLKKEAMDAMREVRDRANRSDGNSTTQPGDDDSLHADHEGVAPNSTADGDTVPIRRSSDPSSPSSKAPSALSAGTLRTANRSDTRSSTNSGSSAGSNSQQQKKTILAATAAATSAARNWSWNAINNARNSKAGGPSHARRASDEPMGRGQPLPPPGVPLPGPQKTGILTGLGGASVKRKPVQPARKNILEDKEPSQDHSIDVADTSVTTMPIQEQDHDLMESPARDDAEMEFGPWNENSGVAGHAQESIPAVAQAIPERADADPSLLSVESPNARKETRRKVPPPLPARRARPSLSETDEAEMHKNRDDLFMYPTNVTTSNAASTGNTHESTTGLIAEAEPAIAVAEDVGEEQASKEELELPDDNEEDAVIAVPAPVEDEEAEENEPKQSESVFEDGEADGDAHLQEIEHADSVA